MAQIARTKAAGKKIEIWFGDEARVGQKNKITRRWALRGTRPIAPHDQRTQSTYKTSSSISPGASCPSVCAIGPTGSNQCGLVLVILAEFYRRKVSELEVSLNDEGIKNEASELLRSLISRIVLTPGARPGMVESISIDEGAEGTTRIDFSGVRINEGVNDAAFAPAP